MVVMGIILNPGNVVSVVKVNGGKNIMNLVKEISITIGGPGGSSDYSRDAKMLQKLLKDSGVENVVIKEELPEYTHDRADDEIKLFLGAKPDKITINVRHYPWGG